MESNCVEAVCSFLQTRNVEADVIENFRSNKMDKAAVWHADEKDLISLGLTERGDIICLKGFVMPRNANTEKEDLASKVRETSKERIASKTKRSKESKIVYLGWMQYDENKKKYVTVRANKGGGVRHCNFHDNTSAHCILQTAKELFLPKDAGTPNNMNICLGNYQGFQVDETTFTLGQYIHENKLTRTRLYMMTRKRTAKQIVRDIALSRNSDIEQYAEPTMSSDLLPTLHSFLQQSRTEQQMDHDSDLSFDTDFPLSNDTLIEFPSTSTFLNDTIVERPRIEIDLTGSLQSGIVGTINNKGDVMVSSNQTVAENTETHPQDAEVVSISLPATANHLQNAESIRAARLRRVVPEPKPSEDHVVMSVRHPSLGTIRRMFKSNLEMYCVYDWVGSLSLQPIYFNLLCNTVPIKPFHSLEHYRSQVLIVQKTSSPPYLEEDGEISISGFGSKIEEDEDAGEKLAEERIFLQSKLKASCELLQVNRHNTVEDLFTIYQSQDVMSSQINISFLGENAVGDGVTRDVYTNFFKSLFQTYSAGIASNVPSGLSDVNLITLGNIISHAFIQYDLFPIQISKAFFEMMVTGNVRESTLTESFMNYVQSNEASLLRSMLSGENVSQHGKDLIIEILSDCGVTKLPTIRNIAEVVKEGAMFVFVKKPYFTMTKIKEGLCPLLTNLNVHTIDNIWCKYKPTVSNVLSYINFGDVETPLEEKVESYLKRYISGSSNEILELFLQFVTGCSTIQNDKILIKFVNQDGRSLAFLAKSCFKIFIVPRQFETFNQFKTTLDNCLRNSLLFEFDDHDV